MDTHIGSGQQMKNTALIKDYINRARFRLEAVELLMTRKSYADVVRESQEVVELVLKAVLRAAKIEVPRVHDVGDILLEAKDSLPKSIRPHVKDLAKISRHLRSDRELAFYGAEDLTPSEFYKEEDAQEALDCAHRVFSICEPTLV